MNGANNSKYSNKVIVTNRRELKSLYGDEKFKLLQHSLKMLISSDQNRAINTQVIYLDDKEEMDRLNAPIVTDAHNDKENKDAIDGVYKAIHPDFLVILGALDIVPMQQLCASQKFDTDSMIPSDLPYACDHEYSVNISDFIAPSRQVGRIPGITGSSDITALLKALDTSISLHERERRIYSDYLAISAAKFKVSTQKNLDNIFGNHDLLHLSPPGGPTWTDEQLAALTHFVNCYGNIRDPKWYGNFFVIKKHIAVYAGQIAGKLKQGTIVAAECCYGGLLYDPKKEDQISICNTYMEGGIAAFCGSTSIAYGSTKGLACADLITQYFIRNFLKHYDYAGAAMLRARHTYVRNNNPMSPADLKTLAEFNLLGDPSNKPVKPDESPVKTMIGFTEEENLVQLRRESKREFYISANVIKESVGFSIFDSEVVPSNEVAQKINEILKEQELTLVDDKILGYRITGGEIYQKSLKKADTPDRMFLVHVKKDAEDASFEDFVLEVRERNGTFDGANLLYRKSNG